MCPSMVGIAFAGQYRDTFATVNPGNDLKFPCLTAWRNCDLTGDPTVQWIYLISLCVDGRSYARRGYSVGSDLGVMGVVLMQLDCPSWLDKEFGCSWVGIGLLLLQSLSGMRLG